MRTPKETAYPIASTSTLPPRTCSEASCVDTICSICLQDKHDVLFSTQLKQNKKCDLQQKQCHSTASRALHAFSRQLQDTCMELGRYRYGQHPQLGAASVGTTYGLETPGPSKQRSSAFPQLCGLSRRCSQEKKATRSGRAAAAANEGQPCSRTSAGTLSHARAIAAAVSSVCAAAATLKFRLTWDHSYCHKGPAMHMHHSQAISSACKHLTSFQWVGSAQVPAAPCHTLAACSLLWRK